MNVIVVKQMTGQWEYSSSSSLIIALIMSVVTGPYPGRFARPGRPVTGLIAKVGAASPYE